MTLSSTTTRVEFTGNGSTTAFAFNFPVLAAGDLTVTIVNSVGTETVQTLDTDYTVAIASDNTSATVNMASAPVGGGTPETLIIERLVALTQLDDFQENEALPSADLEKALDRLTMETQQLNTELGRTVKVPSGDPNSVNMVLPAKANRLGKVFAFNSTSGDPEAVQEIGSFRGNWAPATIYFVRDLVKDTSTNNVFICVTAHTSTGAQPLTTNTDSAKWSLIVDASSSTTAQNNSSTSATAAAASQVAAAASAAAALVSQNASSTSASTSTTQAGISTTQAAASAASAVSSAASAVQSANEIISVAPKFTFSTSTTLTDPGIGIIRFGNSSAASTSSLVIDDQTADSGNPSVEDWLKTFDDSTSTVKGTLRLFEVATPQNYVIYNVTGITDSTGFVQVSVTHVDSNFNSGTTFADTASLRVNFYRSGDLGSVGPQGPVGNTGPTGSAATVAVGTTSTGAAGSSAAVTNSGSSSAAVFDFTVPAGATGSTGASGSAATVAIGTVSTGAPGSSATVTNSGSSTAATLDFSIPQGATGASGSGSGDVTGPGSSVDNAVVRMDGTTGKTVQSSNVVLDDAGILSATGLTLTQDLTVPNGGTGASSFTAHGVLVGNTASAIGVTAVGTSGQVLTSNGSGSDPTFQTISAGGPSLDGNGTGEESIIRTNKSSLTGNSTLTILSGNNGMTAGPLSITSGSSVSIQSSATWHLIGA